MRKINDLTYVDDVRGYAVLAYACPERRAVGLAFCSPSDRLKGKWSREKGSAIAKRRAQVSALEPIIRGRVIDYVFAAILEGHDYVPSAIQDPLYAAAFDVLTAKVPLKRKESV